MSKKGIDIDSVSFSYRKGKQQLAKITAKISQGSFCGVTGKNGSGKSTFTLLLNGLIPQQIKGDFRGNVYVDGVDTRSKPVAHFAKSVGMVFQNPDFMLFNLTVKEELEFGLHNLHLDKINKRISNALEMVGMAEYEKSDPQTLSLGQKQKICLACVLAQDPEYIVLDEPTAMLDYTSSLHLYKILHRLNKEGKTIVIVEHDTDFLLQYASHMIILDSGKISLQGKAQAVFSKTIILRQSGVKIPRPTV